MKLKIENFHPKSLERAVESIEQRRLKIEEMMTPKRELEKIKKESEGVLKKFMDWFFKYY